MQIFDLKRSCECSPDTGCESGTSESKGLSRFLRIDFNKKEVYTAKQAQASRIEKVERAGAIRPFQASLEQTGDSLRSISLAEMRLERSGCRAVRPKSWA